MSGYDTLDLTILEETYKKAGYLCYTDILSQIWEQKPARKRKEKNARNQQ